MAGVRLPENRDAVSADPADPDDLLRANVSARAVDSAPAAVDNGPAVAGSVRAAGNVPAVDSGPVAEVRVPAAVNAPVLASARAAVPAVAVRIANRTVSPRIRNTRNRV